MSTSTRMKDSRVVIDAAMALAASRGWRAVTMTDIAAAADQPLGEIYARFRSKAEILAGLAQQADAEVLTEALTEADDESPRDRLFDVIMRRFDALRPYKRGILALLREMPEGYSALCLMRQLGNSMRWMLEAAAIDTSGLRGSLQAAGLGAIYLNVIRTWLRDDSLDSARTMSELDRQLRWAEQIINSLGRHGRRRQVKTDAGTSAPAGPLDPSI